MAKKKGRKAKITRLQYLRAAITGSLDKPKKSKPKRKAKKRV